MNWTRPVAASAGDRKIAWSSSSHSKVAKKLSARTLRPLRETSPTAVAKRLVDCGDVTAPAGELLSLRDLSDLVHYLNKRYALRLAG